MTDAVGLSRTVDEVLDPGRAAALRVVLGLGSGTEVVPFGHQVHFWEAREAHDLGRDGHPRLGGFIPDLGLPRRMWAGGRLEFAAPLMAGEAARKVTVIEAVERKQGRSGALAFVTLRHEVWQDGRICVTERQDLVYREDPVPGAQPPAVVNAPEACDDERVETFSAVDLFRYSALTFNGHRIHYDADYCREVEGYPGLVVHAPLLAQKLVLMAQAHLGALGWFRFRATAPLIAGETARFCRAGAGYWVAGPDGRLCMEAEAG